MNNLIDKRPSSQVAVLNSPDLDPTDGDEDCKIRSPPTLALALYFYVLNPVFFFIVRNGTFEYNISPGTTTTSMVAELVPFP